jgi:hypothetical protein
MTMETFQRIATLSPIKLELFTRRLLGSQEKQAPEKSIGRVQRRQSLAKLSFSQERMWFANQLESGNPAYNLPAAVRIEGTLNLHEFEQGLNEIIRRHEALRTAFRIIDGQCMQVIAREARLTVRFVDLQSLPEKEREELWPCLAKCEARRIYDLAFGLLLRVALLKLADDDHIALFTIHHIVSDAWSLQLLVRELAELGETFAKGTPSRLAELPIQYADFAVWERERLQGEAAEKQLSYWRSQLSGAPARLRLSTDKPRPPIRMFRGGRRSFQLTAELSERIRALGRQENATVFMTMLAALQTLLYRYTGQEDISVGSPISGRTHPETENIVGCFVNTLVLRIDLSGEPSFRELLRRVRETALEAYMNAGLPFEILVTELQLNRDLTHHPLFQVFFRLDSPSPAISAEWHSVRRLEVENETSKFDLEWSIVETPKGLSGTVIFNSDLFEVETISEMIERYKLLLSEIIQDPDQPLLSLSIESSTPEDDQGAIEFQNSDVFTFEKSVQWQESF